MIDTEELKELARQEKVKEDRNLEIMPVIDILRCEKEFTWAEIAQWLSIKECGNHTTSYWNQRYAQWKAEQKRAGQTTLSGKPGLRGLGDK